MSFNLSQFVGQNIRVRFDFNTIDGAVNNLEGWYLDDVVVRPILTMANASVLLTGPPGTGAAVAGVGDINGDGRGDFAVVQTATAGAGQVYLVYGRAASNPFPSSATIVTLANVRLSDGTGLSGFTVRPAGNLDNDRDAQNDELFDLLITGEDKAYNVFGGALSGNIALQSLTPAAGRVVQVGGL